MSSGTNSERILENNEIIDDNNEAIDNFRTTIENLPDRASALDSYAKMYTNFNTKDFTTMAKVTGWIKGFDAGDYEVQSNNSRIKISNTTLLQICGNCGGNGNAYIEYHIKTTQGEEVINDYSRSCLIQAGGNGYWINALATTIVELDPSETYYIELHASGYNTTFKMNDGFGSSSTWMSALKLK